MSIFDAALHNYAGTADTNFDTPSKMSQKKFIFHITVAKLKYAVYEYRVFHLRMCFLKGLKMSENQYVDKKIRQ